MGRTRGVSQRSMEPCGEGLTDKPLLSTGLAEGQPDGRERNPNPQGRPGAGGATCHPTTRLALFFCSQAVAGSLASRTLLGGWRGRGVQGPRDDPRFITGWSQESSGSSRVPGSHPSGTWGVSWSPVGLESPITFGVGEEPLTLGCSAEWTLETAPCPAVVLAF